MKTKQNVLIARKLEEGEKSKSVFNFCNPDELVMFSSDGRCFTGVESLKCTSAVMIKKIEIETEDLIKLYMKAIQNQVGIDFYKTEQELRKVAIGRLNDIAKWFVKMNKKYKTVRFNV